MMDTHKGDRYFTKLVDLSDRLDAAIEERKRMRAWMILGWIVAGLSNLMLIAVQFGGLCR
jgi:hypothetical protein